MGKQWKKPPVYFVIAQVRFNPVLNLGSYLATIQEDFRKAKFPDFKTALNVTFNVGLLAGLRPGEEQPMQRNERYLFGNEEGTETFILEPTGLTFQTTEYRTFDFLMQTFLSRLEYLSVTLSLSYSDRVGLRYLDAVIPEEKESLQPYLISQVFGLRGKVDGNVQHSFTETLIDVSEGKLLSRVVMQTGPIGFPPDLLMHVNGVKLGSRFATYSGEYAIIDTDGFNDTRSKIDRSTIETKFLGLHKRVDEAFHAIVTERAVSLWS
ncbi:MAG: TIGR04255 family protein [Edaphobacter sp.]|jgi:uncharacterized protein (TIGR04255 family)